VPEQGAADALRRLESALEAARARLSDLSAEHAAIVESARVAPPDDEHDVEGASIGYERERLRALLERESAAVGSLEEAVRAARRDGAVSLSGTRSCRSCGEEIPTERLEALPGTTLCVRCAGAGSGGAWRRARGGRGRPRPPRPA